MYTYEIASVGGQGGGPYDHATDLEAAGHCLGPGAAGARLSLLHVEEWTVLSHNYGVYTSLTDPTKTITTSGQCNIRGGGKDFVIPANHRVVRVRAEAGWQRWAAGATCLNFLEFEVAPVTEPGSPVVTSIGTSRAQKYLSGFDGLCSMEVVIPEGLTLAGIAGRGGDSWDQVRLMVCPWIPDGGAWSPAIHQHLLQPFKQQVRAFLLSLHHLQCSGEITILDHSVTENLVAALFKATFLGEEAAADGAPADCIATWIEEKVQEVGQQHAGAGGDLSSEGSGDSWETDSGSGWSEEYESESESEPEQ